MPVAMCIRCGCCPAQDGFILCIFCEDGLPCAHAADKTRVAQPPALNNPARTDGAQHRLSQPKAAKPKPIPVPQPPSAALDNPKEKTMPECRHPECSKPIRNSKSGCCSKHYYWSTKNPTDGAAKPASKPRKSKVSPPPQIEFQTRRCRAIRRGHDLRNGGQPRCILEKSVARRESQPLHHAAWSRVGSPR